MNINNARPSGLSDIISPDEIKKFYELLPKVQQAEHFLASLEKNDETTSIDDTETILSPYCIELNINCTVTKKSNDTNVAPEKVEEQYRKFYIDFIVSDYNSFIETFYQNITKSLEKTCSDLYKTSKNDDQK